MEIEFINTKYVFSLYKNLQTVDQPMANIDVNQFIEAIQYGYLQEVIETLRSAIPQEEYRRIKRESIPCVTISGTFDHRDSKGLVKHSGLMQVDIDKVEDYDSIFDKICKDTYTYVCFRSPGGKGIKAIVKVNPSAETHRDQFKALEIYYQKQLGVKIDSQCIDLSRCMLLSYDPNLFCNPRSDVFEEVYVPPKISRDKTQPIGKVPLSMPLTPDDPHEVMERIIASLEKQQIDFTSTYADWIKVGFALCATFGEGGKGYFHSISRIYPRYSHLETEAKYIELMSRNDGSTTFGSIVFLAQQAGIKVGRWKKE